MNLRFSLYALDYEEEYSEDEVAFGTDTFAANTDEYGMWEVFVNTLYPVLFLI